MVRSKAEVRAAVRAAVKALYERRRGEGLCVRDNRENGGDPHGKPVEGSDHCRDCLDRKADQRRAAYARKKKGTRS